MSYQREIALSLAVQFCSGTIFSEESVLQIADEFLNWLTNNVEGA